MSARPLDVGVIVDRLRSAVPSTQLRSVGRAADYAAVRGPGDFPAPCAYVLLAAERPAAQPLGQAPRGTQVAVRQFVEATFGVVLVARNYREQGGDQVADELGALTEATRQALMGYVPDLEGARPCQLVRGDLLDYAAGVGVWADVYVTQHAVCPD